MRDFCEYDKAEKCYDTFAPTFFWLAQLLPTDIIRTKIL